MPLALVSTLAQPLGAALGKALGGGSDSTVPNTSSAGLNSSGSYYNLNSGGTSSASGGVATSTINIALIGGALLVALFIWKRK